MVKKPVLIRSQIGNTIQLVTSFMFAGGIAALFIGIVFLILRKNEWSQLFGNIAYAVLLVAFFISLYEHYQAQRFKNIKPKGYS
jgi:hypothetical protein